MTLEEFLAICELPDPPASLDGALEALYWDGRGDWARAHTVAQGIETPMGSAIHAYLHRKEGDVSNARYWYGRAGRSLPAATLDEEWRALARELCRAG